MGKRRSLLGLQEIEEVTGRNEICDLLEDIYQHFMDETCVASPEQKILENRIRLTLNDLSESEHKKALMKPPEETI